MLSSMLGNGGTRHFSIASKNASGRFGRPVTNSALRSTGPFAPPHDPGHRFAGATIDSQGYLKDLEIIDAVPLGYWTMKEPALLAFAAPFTAFPNRIPAKIHDLGRDETQK